MNCTKEMGDGRWEMEVDLSDLVDALDTLYYVNQAPAKRRHPSDFVRIWMTNRRPHIKRDHPRRDD